MPRIALTHDPSEPWEIVKIEITKTRQFTRKGLGPFWESASVVS